MQTEFYALTYFREESGHHAALTHWMAIESHLCLWNHYLYVAEV